MMLLLLHEPGLAVTPLNVMVLLPCWSPKLVPVRVTAAPIAAEVGDTRVITGITRKDLMLLANPLTVTITSAKPVGRLLGTGTMTLVAVHELGTTVMPPKVTTLLPCVVPKLLPLMLT